MQFYFTSNQSSSVEDLGISDVYETIASLGQRLRVAMGAEEILPRNHTIGGEFRVPTFRSYAERLDRGMWTCYNGHGQTLRVVPYNSLYEGWKPTEHNPRPFGRSGFMATACNPYEYAYDLWDDWTHKFHPDLFDNGTFGVWLELLPQPASVFLAEKYARINWSPREPRVHRSEEMGRYQLDDLSCYVEVIGPSWRVARAEAYVRAWEKMAANEPADRHKAAMLAERARLEERWNRPRTGG